MRWLRSCNVGEAPLMEELGETHADLLAGTNLRRLKDFVVFDPDTSDMVSLMPFADGVRRDEPRPHAVIIGRAQAMFKGDDAPWVQVRTSPVDFQYADFGDEHSWYELSCH